MRATTTDNVREHFRPGDEIANGRAEVSTVFKVMHSGYGFAGVLLTQRPGRNGRAMRYVVWVVSAEGRVRATMTTDDFPAANAAFTARIVEAAREIGMGEVTA